MQFGLASESDFGPALLFRYERPETSTDVAAVSMGKQISDSLFGWPAVVVAYGSLQSFGERGRQPDILGATAYMKVYRQFYLGERGLPVRIGLGTRRGLAARRGGWGKGVRFASHGDVSLR